MTAVARRGLFFFIWMFALSLAGGAHAAWQADGVPVCTASGDQTRPIAIPDGLGGAYIVWEDARSGESQIYAQRIDALGNPMWAANGILVSSGFFPQSKPVAVADGVGNVVIAWILELVPGARTAQGQKLNSAGVAQWGQGGIPVTPGPAFPVQLAIISDNRVPLIEAPGVILAWTDIRPGTHTDIYAQALDAAGAPRWGTNGVLVCNAAGNQLDLVMTTDGSGATLFQPRGAILAWVDERAGSTDSDLYAQRLNSAGVPQWTANGMPVAALSSNVQEPVIVRAASANAIVGWLDGRHGRVFSLYAQRIGTAGEWVTNGLPVVPPGDRHSQPAAVSDGSAGVIAAWVGSGPFPSRLIYAQRLDANGSPMWPDSGIRLSKKLPVAQSTPVLLRTSSSVIAAWLESKAGETDVYAQKVDFAGNTEWGLHGVALCKAPGLQLEPTISPDTTGGAFVAWTDYRNGGADIYANRVTGAGEAVAAPSVTPAALQLRAPFPNPTASGVSCGLELAVATEVSADLFDTGGRRVRRLLSGHTLAAGVHLISWDGADDAGRRLEPGVYWLSVRAGDARVARRVLIHQ